VAELGRPISERLQAFARNGRLKRRIGAPRVRVLVRALTVGLIGPAHYHVIFLFISDFHGFYNGFFLVFGFFRFLWFYWLRFFFRF
jgi:hypothetical protein